MIYSERLDVNQPKAMDELASFLNKNDLTMDKIDAALVLKEDGIIIGSCCKFNNVLKMIAIDCNYQQNNLTATLLSEMQHILFEQNITHSFIFTPVKHKHIFTSLFYHEVIATDEVVLLEKGSQNIDQTIQNIIKQYNIQKGNHGAIVINGNPMTLGHQYLIEQASQQVDRLFVFVVEEDVSFFSFEFRYRLIEKNTKHLDNVVVLASTSYIISHATFPNYFMRDLDHHFKMYATLDVSLFAKHFSKLFIQTRFVGEEPLDPMTNMYNQMLRKELPKHGMHLKIIPRKESNHGVISASKVRECLKQGDYIKLKDFVSDLTYKEIMANKELVEKAKTYDKTH